MSVATVAFCLGASKSVTAALREAGMLPANPAPAERSFVEAEEAAEAAA